MMMTISQWLQITQKVSFYNIAKSEASYL